MNTVPASCTNMLAVLHEYLRSTEYVQELNKNENMLLLIINPLLVLKINILTLLTLVVDLSEP